MNAILLVFGSAFQSWIAKSLKDKCVHKLTMDNLFAELSDAGAAWNLVKYSGRTGTKIAGYGRPSIVHSAMEDGIVGYQLTYRGMVWWGTFPADHVFHAGSDEAAKSMAEFSCFKFYDEIEAQKVYVTTKDYELAFPSKAVVIQKKAKTVVAEAPKVVEKVEVPKAVDAESVEPPKVVVAEVPKAVVVEVPKVVVAEAPKAVVAEVVVAPKAVVVDVTFRQLLQQLKTLKDLLPPNIAHSTLHKVVQEQVRTPSITALDALFAQESFATVMVAINFYLATA